LLRRCPPVRRAEPSSPRTSKKSICGSPPRSSPCAGRSLFFPSAGAVSRPTRPPTPRTTNPTHLSRAPGRPCEFPHSFPVIARLSREAAVAVLVYVPRERDGGGRSFYQGAAPCPVCLCLHAVTRRDHLRA